MQSFKTVSSILGIASSALLSACGAPMEGEEETAVLGEALGTTTLMEDFGIAQGWTAASTRLLADMNGDGRNDIFGIKGSNAYISYAAGSGFAAKQRLDFSAAGWDADNPRMIASVDSDNKGDVVVFLDDAVYVSYSTGGWRFLEQKVWGMGVNDGWTVSQHPRMLGDVSGDGKDDIVAFGYSGVLLSFSLPNVLGFTTPVTAQPQFGYEQGWRSNLHPRMLADVNGDGRKDVVGFKNDGVWLSLSTGSGLTAATRVLQNQFGYDSGWRVEQHPRMLADVNGDRRADIVGFASDGVYVSLSTGTSFTSATRWTQEYDYGDGWRVDMHPRFVTDISGDGRADIIGIENRDVYAALSTGNAFAASALRLEGFGYSHGWRVDQHPRFITDISGDRRGDFVGFGYYGVSFGSL